MTGTRFGMPLSPRNYWRLQAFQGYVYKLLAPADCSPAPPGGDRCIPEANAGRRSCWSWPAVDANRVGLVKRAFSFAFDRLHPPVENVLDGRRRPRTQLKVRDLADEIL